MAAFDWRRGGRRREQERARERERERVRSKCERVHKYVCTLYVHVRTERVLLYVYVEEAYWLGQPRRHTLGRPRFEVSNLSRVSLITLIAAVFTTSARPITSLPQAYHAPF